MREKILKIIEARKLSMSELARLAELPQTTISNLVNRDSLPRVDNALRVAKSLGVSLEWLVDDQQDWPPVPLHAVEESLRMLKPEPAQFVRQELARLDRTGHGMQLLLASALAVYSTAMQKQAGDETTKLFLHNLATSAMLDLMIGQPQSSPLSAPNPAAAPTAKARRAAKGHAKTAARTK